MARALITPEQVAEAAEACVARGEEPSIIVVQGMLGAGSYTTVKRYLDAWKQARRVQPEVVAVPPDVAAQAEAFARAVWQAATALADQRVAEVRTATAQQIAAGAMALEQAEGVIARQESELDRLAQQVDEALRERDARQQALDAAREMQQAAEGRAAELGAQVAGLQQQVERQRQELDEARAALLAQAQLAGEAEALRRQVRDLTAMIERLSART